jgi:hypothetical protein
VVPVAFNISTAAFTEKLAIWGLEMADGKPELCDSTDSRDTKVIAEFLLTPLFLILTKSTVTFGNLIAAD